MELKDENGNFNAALLDHVRQGSVELMPQALLRNDNPDLIDEEGKTLLHYAAESDNVSMTRHFINNNHNIDIVDNHGNSPLMLAMDQDSYNAAKLLVEAGGNIFLRSDGAVSILSSNKPNLESRYFAEHQPPYGIRELFLKLKNYQEFVKTVVRQLRKDCHDDNQLLLTRLRDFGCSLIHVINLGDANVTRFMLRNGFSVDERNIENNETALHEAVKLLDIDNVKVLLEFGASVSAVNKRSLPPIYYLYDDGCIFWRSDSRKEEEKRVEIMKILIEHGALPSRVPDENLTPVRYILETGGLRVLTALMQYDVEYNSFYTLECLVCNANDDALEVLRGKNIEVNYQNQDSLLSTAVLWHSLRKVQFLLEHGANPNAVDVSDGKTPLIYAVSDLTPNLQERVLAIVRRLLQYGADAQHVVTDENQEQQTVFNRGNSGEVMESIIAHLAMVESCGVIISDLIRGEIDSRDTYKQHFRVCKKQIERMKNTTVNGSVTLYKLLTESHLRITKYARDPEFTAKFEEAMKDKRFLDRYYSISLHKRVGKAIQEAKLIEDATFVLRKIFPCCFRNCHGIFYLMLGYLSCDDLKNIYKVYNLPDPNLST